MYLFRDLQVNRIEIGDLMRVEKFLFFIEQKVLSIRVEGAWIGEEEVSKLGSGVIMIFDWSTMSGKCRRGGTQPVLDIDLAEPLIMDEITYITLSSGTTKLEGFGVDTGLWIEYEFDDARIIAEFEE